MAEPKVRVLVIDDSKELQDYFRFVLNEAGYDVVTASSAEEGLAQARTLKPALILLDFVMPGMDGLEFLTRLRSDFAPPLPPTILCTGFELAEEEALRRGALMLLRKPVAPEDLREFVAFGLLGERISAETAARERANSAAARTRVRNAATTLVARIHKEAEHQIAGNSHMAWLAAYFGLETAVSALMENGRLIVFAAAGSRSLTMGGDLTKRLPPCLEILESGSSLVLADASVHPYFSAEHYRLQGVRFFAGVPLLSPEGDPIGVICLVDAKARRTYAEDLTILEVVGRQGSLLLRLLTLGRPASELPGRLGPGMMLRPSFEVVVDAELRRLHQSSGSMEVAVVEMDDPQQMREAVLQARNPERLAAGALGPTRVAVYKRDPLDGAAGAIRTLLANLERTIPLRAVGAAGIEGAQLPAVTGQDLLRLAELTLEKALQVGGGTQRLVLHHEVSGIRDALTSGLGPAA